MRSERREERSDEALQIPRLTLFYRFACRRLDITDPCITLADGDGDCESPVIPTPSPVVAESVVVDGSLSFSGFQAESFPSEGTSEYESFKGDVQKGIATSLGVDADKVTILVMTLWGRRVRARR